MKRRKREGVKGVRELKKRKCNGVREKENGGKGEKWSKGKGYIKSWRGRREEYEGKKTKERNAELTKQRRKMRMEV